jgi:hypothetical protein
MTKKLHCAYLFADGHTVLVYEKYDRQAGEVQWVEIFEKFGPQCKFEGRIVFHWGSNGLVELCRKAIAVSASAPSLGAGSTRTKELGIAVGTLELQLGRGALDTVRFHDLDGVLSAPYHYQPEVAEAFDPKMTHWADHQVAKIHRLPAKLQPAQSEPGT